MTGHSFFSSSTLRRGALIAAVSVGALALGAGEASAQWRRHYYRGGGWGPGAVAAGVVSGLAVGALAAGAEAPYYGPVYGPAPVYARPHCWIEPEDSWNGYRWVRHNVRVCD